MPNIEIHGLNRTDSSVLAKEVFDAIEQEVPELMEIAVITLSDDFCFNAKGEPQPYFRIASTKAEHYEALKKVLAQFKMDIETLDLKEFIPA